MKKRTKTIIFITIISALGILMAVLLGREYLPAISLTYEMPNTYNETDLTTENSSAESRELDQTEFSLRIDNSVFSLGGELKLNSNIGVDEMIELPEEFPYPASKIYNAVGLTIKTFLENNETEINENIYYICTKRPYKTPRNIGVGSSLEELNKAYNELYYEENWRPSEDDPQFNRVYIYRDVIERNYIAFFIQNQKIVMLEIANGFDIIPGKDLSMSNILGYYDVIKEINNMSPTGAQFRYTITVGTQEKELFSIQARFIYEADFDEDGLTELMVYKTGNTQSIDIYDMVDGKLTVLNVNETMKCEYSTGLEDVSNLNSDFKNHIQIGIKNVDGKIDTQVYKYSDGTLTYVCPFEDVLLP